MSVTWLQDGVPLLFDKKNTVLFVGVTQKATKLQVAMIAACSGCVCLCAAVVFAFVQRVFERVAQDDSRRFLKEAKDAMKPSYGSRKTRGSSHAFGDSGGESAGRQALTFDEKALQLRKVSTQPCSWSAA